LKALLQRVSSANVVVEQNVVGEIDDGLLVFIGISSRDSQDDIDYIVDKTINLRIFPDEEGRFDRSLADINGSLLLVSQFTLYGDTKKGRRPSFTEAMPSDSARTLFDDTVNSFSKTGLRVEKGIFQAEMEVSLVNSGPVTIILDSEL
jgi:D-tyrosyl-tRNA(Tyr) deacylase|tara:strand:+ start:238 stop:681 length:444 start_codon:yes stop_codon:yes gene_type:complete